MPTEILVKTGTPIIWADATDWPVDGAHGLGNETYQLDLTSVATTKARQAVKGDLGATRAANYFVKVAIEFAVAPAIGATVDIYWSPSQSATAATGNDGGASGADDAYKNSEESEWLAQCIYLGSLSATADATPTVQIQTVGKFSPPARYGMPIVRNATAQAFHNDAVEMFVALIPIVDEAQTA